MKVPYIQLFQNHYSSDLYNNSFKPPEDVYAETGYDFAALQRQNSAYQNTCATRMSLALIKSHVSFVGRLTIKSGKYKGRLIEPGSKLLADQLSLPGVFGKPTICTPKNVLSHITGKKGVIFFWKIEGYEGGHIDLIDFHNGAAVCHSHCYFQCKEIWFWELK